MKVTILNTSARHRCGYPRSPEGKILTSEEIEQIGYEWGILESLDAPIQHQTSEEDVFKPSRTKRVWWWMRNKYWWWMDHVIVPIICFLLVIGFVCGATAGLTMLLSPFIGE